MAAESACRPFPADFIEGKSSFWVGPDKYAVNYFLRGGALLNFFACVELDEWIEESWTLKRPRRELKADFYGWHEDIHAIIDAADWDEYYGWALNVYPALDNWSTPRATLIGDAAHPTLPYSAQGAAMAVEDAAVLTRAVGEASSIDEALHLYQRNRLEWTGRIVREAYENLGLFNLETIEALRAAFAKRDMDQERSDWLYAYNVLTVDLV